MRERAATMRDPSSRPDAPLHCPHFGACGGCSSLDVPIAEQLAHKQARARELLATWLGGVEPAIALPPRTPRHDRTSILYPAQLQHRELQLGIYRTGSHDVEPIRDCRIQHKALTALAVRMGDVLRTLRLPVYIEATGHGLVRGVRARVMPGSNELLAGVLVTREQFSERAKLARALHEVARDLRDDQGRPLHLVGLVHNVNDRPGNVLLGPSTVALHGQTFQTDVVADLRLRVSFTSFYQLHRHAEAILFRPALAMLGDVAGLRIVDGYGGVGTFALRLLRAGAAHATLIESSPSSAADARVNFEQNGFAARAEVREQPFGEAPLPACDLLIADPPRAGLQATGAAAIVAAAPPRVLLVSCALESLARDLAALAAHYRVVACGLCDLFPHTEHVEALTLLERRA
jgi:23S rRNA (uracil1939-C5)-methyltransferase